MRHTLLKIITPEKLVHEEEVDSVTIPTTEGYITVLPGHVPLVVSIGKGDIVAHKDGQNIPFVVVGGFVQVLGDEVAVMADFATTIDEKEVEKAKARAEELKRKFDNKEIVDFEHFESELERSLVHINIGDKWRTRAYRPKN